MAVNDVFHRQGWPVGYERSALDVQLAVSRETWVRRAAAAALGSEPAEGTALCVRSRLHRRAHHAWAYSL